MASEHGSVTERAAPAEAPASPIDGAGPDSGRVAGVEATWEQALNTSTARATGVRPNRLTLKQPCQIALLDPAGTMLATQPYGRRR
jgi:hypothetical protein